MTSNATCPDCGETYTVCADCLEVFCGCDREQSLAEARAVIDSECDRLQTAAAVEPCEEGGTEETPW